MNIPTENTPPVFHKNNHLFSIISKCDGAIEPYTAEHNVCNDENDYDYESPELVIDPDTIPEKFELSPTKFHMTKTKVENLAPSLLSKLQQKYKQEEKQLKLSLPETFPSGQGTELIRLLSSTELDGEDGDDEMDEVVKMYQASDSLSRFLFF